MTIKEAYKDGFAEGLVDVGLTPSVFDDLLVKKADDDAGWKKLLYTGAIGLPLIAGWSMGASKRTSEKDMQALTDMALLKDYQDAIRQMQARQKSKDRQKKSPLIKANAKTAAVIKKMPGPIQQKIEAAKTKVISTGAKPQPQQQPQPQPIAKK